MKKYIDLPTDTEEQRETNARIAKQIHYPECWDTSCYTTLASALWELCDIEYNGHECPTCGEKGPPTSSEPTTKTFEISSSCDCKKQAGAVVFKECSPEIGNFKEKPKVEYRNPENLSPEVIGNLKKGWRLFRTDEYPRDKKFDGHRAAHAGDFEWDYKGCAGVISHWTYATDLPEPGEKKALTFSEEISLIEKYNGKQAFENVIGALKNLNDRVAALEKEGK